MRFKALHITGFALLILLTLLLLGRQSLTALLITSILFAFVIIVKLLVALIDDELSFTHLAITSTLFLSLGFLVINYMGQATLTTFFLGATLIVTYFVMIILVLVTNWKHYKTINRIVDSMSAEDKKEKQPSIPAQSLIEEPPRFQAKQGDEGEWVEIKIEKPKKPAAKKTSRKKTTKKK